VAVDHALSLARSQELDVCILCVDSSRSRPAQASLSLASKGIDILAVAEARALAAGVSYETHLGYGNVVEAICHTATARQCDAVLLGSRGLTGVKRLMIGSISNAVTAKILLPVLIVKRFVL
jgi:nucleotide-binding universal stress UspA family protein